MTTHRIESRLRLAAIVESSDDAIIGADMNGLITDWNSAAMRLYGYSADEVIGKPVSFLAPPDKASEGAESMANIRRGDTVKHFETVRQKKDGTCVEVSLTVFPIFDTEGRVIGASAIVRDITEGKRQEAALRESQERFRLAMNNVASGLYTLDLQGLVTYVNPAAETMFGWTNAELLGKKMHDVTHYKHPDGTSFPASECPGLQVLQKGIELREHEDTFIRKDGNFFPVVYSVSPLKKDGQTVGIVVGFRDDTQRRKAEQAMRESEERLRMAAQAGKMVAYEWDAATDRIVYSEGGAQILGEDEGTHITGQHIFAMLPPEDREKLIAARAHLSPDKPYLQIRHRMIRLDGTVIWVDRNCRAYFDEQGKILRIVGMVTDVTDRVQSDEALRQKESELSEAQRLARIGSWYCDARNGTVTWSEELYRIAGLDPSLPAPTHKDEPRYFAADSWERMQPAIQEALRNGTSYELDLEMVRPDGTTRWVKANGEAVIDATGRIVALRGTAQDITERKRAEEGMAAMSRKLLDAQEQERARIARELHDDVGQRLALLSVGIEQIKESLSSSELRNQIDELERQTSEVSADIQSLSHDLHSSRLEHVGVVSAMKGFCKEFGDKHNVQVDFSSEGVPSAVPQEIALCLFRIMQEGLRNALKHSRVRFFEVKLHGSSAELLLTVRDSGMGFDPELARNTPGLGLISMQERARLVEGTFSITSRAQSGTEIRVNVPLATGTHTERAKLAGT